MCQFGENQIRELTTRGESLIRGAGDGDSQTEEFRSLFLDTWQTLRETVTAWGVTPKAVTLFVGLAQEYRRAMTSTSITLQETENKRRSSYRQ